MNEQSEKALDPATAVDLTADIVSAFVSNHAIAADGLPALIKSVHSTLVELGSGAVEKPVEKQKPAVPISKSVTDEYIYCLEDAKPLKMLKRYLGTHYNMTPEEYRRKWGLPADYPMVAPAYTRKRSAFAKEFGLGRRK